MTDVRVIPDNYPRVCPYLHIEGAAAAIEFYAQVFGATERMRLAGADGRIGHAEQKQTIAVQLEELGDRIGIVHLHLDIHDQRATTTEQPAAERWRGLAESINPALTGSRTGRSTPQCSTAPSPTGSTSTPSCRR